MVLIGSPYVCRTKKEKVGKDEEVVSYRLFLFFPEHVDLDFRRFLNEPMS